MELDATSLHELYSPLWAKVPETMPAELLGWDYDYGAAYLESPNGGWHLFADKHPEIVEVNAALCRVACEDWLDEYSPATLTMPGKGRDGGYFIATADDDDHHGCWRGPTIHHALVAAALAVAGQTPDRCPKYPASTDP